MGASIGRWVDWCVCGGRWERCVREESEWEGGKNGSEWKGEGG